MKIQKLIANGKTFYCKSYHITATQKKHIATAIKWLDENPNFNCCQIDTGKAKWFVTLLNGSYLAENYYNEKNDMGVTQKRYDRYVFHSEKSVFEL